MVSIYSGGSGGVLSLLLLTVLLLYNTVKLCDISLNCYLYGWCVWSLLLIIMIIKYCDILLIIIDYCV